MSVLGLRHIPHGWNISWFKLLLRIGLFIAVAFTYLLYLYLPKLLHQIRPTYEGLAKSDFLRNTDKKEITILRWTPEWGQRSNDKILTAKECPYLKPSRKGVSGVVFDIPCRITYNRSYMRASDALVFHSWDLTKEKTPKNRSKDQLWVYLQQECPSYTKLNLRDYPSVFNWTMTYRRDSDIYYPYGLLVPRGNTETAPVTGSIVTSNPTKRKKNSLNLGKRLNLVAWIVSSCESASKREDFVKELQKDIPVSIYGRCGKACPTDSSMIECYAHVGKNHKFYLSFEGGLCKDYITEKFFYALRNNLVPVVYGGTSLEDYSAIAPSGSYIDARNFTSAKHLAEYLAHLDRNEEEYMKYFEWKSKYKVSDSQGRCNLCQKVFEHLQYAPESSSAPSEQKRNYKWYNDIWTWWNYLSYDKSLLQDERSTTSPACQAPIRKLTRSDGNKTVRLRAGIL